MAKTIAKAIGCDSTREKETHRLGSKSAWVRAATWKTFITAEVQANGAGWVTVTRGGKTLLNWSIEPEVEPEEEEE